MKRFLIISFFLFSYTVYGDQTEDSLKNSFLLSQCLRVWGIKAHPHVSHAELMERCLVEIEEGKIFTPVYAEPISKMEEKYVFNDEYLIEKIQISYPTILKISFLRALDKIFSESQADINKIKAKGTVILRVGNPSEFDIIIYDGKKMLTLKGNYIIIQNNLLEVKK